MKKFLTSMLVAIAATTPAGTFAGTPINQTELPKEARTFITKYFSKDEVLKVEQDHGFRGPEYEVDFMSGAEVDFTSDGKWKEVKAAHGTSVPSAIVPAAIAKYVETNFNGLTIVEISRMRGGYDVELSNGTELKLTEDAKPMQPRQGGRGHRR